MRVQRQRRRPAFTLVEMMVATALCLFIMAIIAQAFGAATHTFTTMRTAGQLQNELRTGTVVIRRDLAAEHYAGPYIAGRSGPRVGDQRMDLSGWVPPPYGYFEIRQATQSLFEPGGTLVPTVFDGEGMTSTRATNHTLRFTSRLPDLPASELFCCEAPPVPNPMPANPTLANVFASAIAQSSAFYTGQPIFYSRWGEIAYWLELNPAESQTTPGGLPRFSLRRKVRVLPPRTIDFFNEYKLAVPVPANANDIAVFLTSYPELPLAPRVILPPAPGQQPMLTFVLMGPDAVNNPVNRIQFTVTQKPTNNGMIVTGDDILMTDVLSFEIKAAWFNNPTFNTYAGPGGGAVNPSPPLPGMAAGNSDEPFADLVPLPPLQPPANPQVALNPNYANQRVFDTWFPGPNSNGINWERPLGNGYVSPGLGQPPQRINVRAVQIKLRVWHEKAEQARQVTLIQEI